MRFKVDTASSDYHLEIYRMGYYGGDGARRVDEVDPSVPLPQDQPPCEAEDPDEAGLVDCGNWHQSASWPVPASAVSGIYFAKLVRDDKPSSEGSHVIFVVRDDGGNSDLLFQTSDTTWQAYNEYGGNSLYEGGPGTAPGRAYKVSYNRPLTTRETTPEDAPFAAEYPMVRWLERNGYDVSYSTGVDSDRRGTELLQHKVFLSVGHDEYWSGPQRANVEAAREAGVNLAFFSGNEIFWKTRWENSIDGADAPYRTLVSYKETHANAKIDPEADVWTGTWRDPRFSPPADGGQPENSLSGTIFTVGAGTGPIEVPAAYAKMRLWRDTSVAELGTGETATLADGTLGYEWDEDLDNGARPPGLANLSSTTMEVPQKLIDYGSNYAPGTATHHLTLYRAPSGALVFGAGTVQWSWGLDGEHDRGGSTADPRMQQATTNLFADMGVQPATLQGNLTAATQTTDGDPPATTISFPADGAQLESGQPIAISGIANDVSGETAGGQVAGVEVSTDGGQRWHPAEGRDHWTYKWTPGNPGSADILARAVDDSANLEEPGAEVGTEVVPNSCPCSIWDETFSAPEEADPDAVEVGVKFRSDTAGFITGLRFYKTAANTGVHVGHLWTAAGAELAEATFSGESATGWQQVQLDGPVAIEPGTTYVASYHAPNGHYAAIDGYFSLVGTDSAPLHALADGVDGGNGVFKYGHAGGLFTGDGPQTFGAANYLVDVVFEKEAGTDTTAPKISFHGPAQGAIDVSTKTTIGATFSEAMAPASLNASSVDLRNGSGSAVPATISYSPALRRLSVDPTAELQSSASYSVTIRGGAGGATDLAGNPLAQDTTWSFTTAAPPPPPPDQGPGGPILVISNAANPFSQYYAEILRAEGLNAFASTDVSALTPAVLDSHDVAILGEGSLSSAQAQMLNAWVEAGGNLIAMRPDPQLAGLLGLSAAGGTLANAYLKVDTGTEPGAGIVAQTMQFHGPADRYAASGAETIATLYSNASTATSSPAVTLREVGSKGGQAAAFTYDLARSVVYTRQGNPAWAGQNRDDEGAVRSDDLFFGAMKGDEQPDWVDLNKVAIPQADEQQRLLTNLIERMNVDRKPIPRFWFLPRDEKAAVVMTGDDHARGGTVGRFDQYEAESPPGCVVANWECVRATSYIFPSTPLTDGEVATYTAAGFEIGLHTLTNCENWGDRAQLESFYSSQLEALTGNFPSLPAPTTNRTHCIVWSDWATQPKVERQNGIRLDTTYYYWPGAWVKDRPGMFTGSGMPMRFADLDGSTIDVYQAATQMTDESEQTYPFTVDTLLDNALGSSGYYGVFTANMHTDEVESPDSDAVIASAKARGVPVVSAKQMLTWLDGRNRSTFDAIKWAGHRLSFTISPGSGANGLRAMLPIASSAGDLVSIERAGAPVTTTTQAVKGIDYAFFDATAGSYSAVYEVPELSATVPASPASSNSPTITGSAPAGTTVRIYTSADCSGTPVATGTAAQLATGIGVTVPADSTTSFRATATSAAKTSACSQPLTYVEDSTAPVVAIDSLSSDLLGAGGSSELQWHGNENGSFALRLGGTDCSTGTVIDSGSYADQPALHTSTVTVAQLAEGMNALRLCVLDGAANSGQANVAVRKDTTAPETQIDLEPTDPAGSASAEFGFSGDDGSGSGIAGFECRLDAAAFAPCASPQAYGSLAEGSHAFQVRAIDVAGNSDASPSSYDWTVDTTPPAVTVDSGPSGLTNDATPTFAFHSAEAGVGFECSIDTGTPSFAPCATTGTHTPAAPLGDGPYSFRVRATDAAGNQASASRDFTVDTVIPPAPSLGAVVPAGPANENSPTLTGSAAAGTTVRIYASADCSGTPVATASAAELAAGVTVSVADDTTASFRATATSAASNTSACSGAVSYSEDSSAPQTQIDSGPSGAVNVDSAAFAFSSEPGAGFECRLDSSSPADWASCSSPKSLDSLADGPHSIEVRAVDAAANADATPAVRSWSVDTAAPAVTIDSISAEPVGVGGTEVRWHAGENGSFALRLGGTDCSTGTVIDSGSYADQPAVQTSTVTAAQLAEGANTLRLCVIDAALNSGQTSAVVNKDTTAPNTQIGTKPGDPTGSSSAEFGFSGSDGSGSGIAGFECRLDDAAFAPCASPQTYGSLADGAHAFEVRAIDGAGNADPTPASFVWTVDSTAPIVSIESPANDLVGVGGSTEVQWRANENGAFALRVGGSDCLTGTVVDSGTYADQPALHSSNVTAAQLEEGENTLRLCLTDGAASTGAAATSVSKDTIAPETTITARPPSLSSAATVSFSFEGDPGSGSEIASLECRLDSTNPADWLSCDSGDELGPLANGPHQFEVRATDAAGNTDPTPVSFDWTIDTVAPHTEIDSGPSGTVGVDSASFEFSAEPDATFECRLDSTNPADWASCSSGEELGPLADGPHVFEVRATDAAGNTDASPARRSWSVDTAAPAVTIDSLSKSLLGAGDSAELRWYADQNGDFSLRAGGGDCSSGSILDSGSYSDQPAVQTAIVTAAQLAEGPNSLRLCLTDASANTGAATVSASRDTIAPETALLTQPDNPSNSASAAFGFSGSDLAGSGIASLQCSLDGAAFAACVSPQEYSSLADGPHRFETRAIDAAGNVDPVPAVYLWSVDTTVPPETPPAADPPPGVSLGPVRLLGVRYNERRGLATLLLEVPGPGRLSVRTPEEVLRKLGSTSPPQRQRTLRQIRTTSVLVPRATRVKLAVKLTPAAQKLLAESAKLRLKVELTFEPEDGPKVSKTATIVLKRKPPVSPGLPPRTASNFRASRPEI